MVTYNSVYAVSVVILAPVQGAADRILPRVANWSGPALFELH